MHRPVLSLLALGSLALAADPVTVPVAVQPAAERADWRFLIAPYVQFPNIEITNKSGVLPLTYIDLDFNDVLDNASGGLAVRGEAWRGRLGLLLDVSHLDLDGENIASIPVNDGSGVTADRSLELGYDQLVVEAVVAYGLSPDENDRCEIYAGVRYWDVTVDMGARLVGSGGLVDESRSYSIQHDWIDPVIGLRGTSPLGAKAFLTGWFDIGGGFYGAEWSTSSAIYVGWKLDRHLHVLAGFEAQYVYYDNDESGDGRFVYENFTYGPVLSVAVPF